MYRVIPFIFRTPHTEEYLKRCSPRIFYLILTHQIRYGRGKQYKSPTDFEETLILTHRIGLWKSNQYQRPRGFRINLVNTPLGFSLPYPFLAQIFSSVWGVRLKNEMTHR